MQIKNHINDNEVQNQELLTLDTISPIWVKLKANYFHIISDDCNCILKLNTPQRCSWISIWFFVGCKNVLVIL